MFFVAAGILLIFSFLNVSQQAIDLAIGDTYIVIGINQICCFLSVYFALLGFGLRYLRKIDRPLKPIWLLVYWLLSITMVLVIAWVLHQFSLYPKVIRFDETLISRMLYLNNLLSISILSFLLIQVGFAGMLVWRVFRKK